MPYEAYDDAAYDQLMKDANTDNRVGDHLFMVTSTTQDTWPDGQPRLKIKGVLQTASNAKADITLSETVPPDVVKSQSATWDKRKQRAVSDNNTMCKQLRDHYRISADKISEGDIYAVKTVKTKIDENGKGGFIRVVAFLPKDRIGKDVAAAASDAPPPF